MVVKAPEETETIAMQCGLGFRLRLTYEEYYCYSLLLALSALKILRLLRPIIVSTMIISIVLIPIGSFRAMVLGLLANHCFPLVLLLQSSNEQAPSLQNYPYKSLRTVATVAVVSI